MPTFPFKHPIFAQAQPKVKYAVLTAAAFTGALLMLGTKQSGDPQKWKIIKQDAVEQNKYLTERLAQVRFSQIKPQSINYFLHIKLQKGQSYEAVLHAEFELNTLDYDVYFDYRGQEIKSVIINGSNLAKRKIKWNKLFLQIPKSYLMLAQPNTVTIHFVNNYSTDGTGLHSYIDQDGKQYLYSQGEAFFNNKFFPCMDQPDLKARMKMTVVSPVDWIVISNEHFFKSVQFDYKEFVESTQGKGSPKLLASVFKDVNVEQNLLWDFCLTPLLPTYLFGLMAGNYVEFTSKVKHRNVTFSIYCRESLKEYMENLKEFVLEVTKKSMQFYEEFFGVEYQFRKYDSVFVPEFNYGAMENPGCVTFNDSLIYKEQKPKNLYSRFANTIAHEMAHHWFGDFVTMKWWNDLWLNESYADFISHYCLQNIKIESLQLSDISVMFNLRKAWGYREDQMVTTHSIACDVPNTEVAEDLFDGITYSKGASTMKQLMHLITPKVFGKTCGKYFKKYGFSNATLDNLIDELSIPFSERELGFSLYEWKKEWIQTTGMNEIECVWDQNEYLQSSILTIRQKPALEQFPTLRRHKLKLALFREDCTLDVKELLIQNTEQTQIFYDATQNYKAMLLNYEDYAFVKVVLDPQSNHFFQENLNKIQDPLTRTLIYRALYDLVSDAKISSEEYVNAILNQFGSEQSDDLISTQLLFLERSIEAMTPHKFKPYLGQKVFNFLETELKQINNNPNKMILYKNALFSFTQNEEAIGKLLDWWKGENENLKHLELSIDQKWRIIELVYSSKHYHHEQRKELLDQIKELDKSDQSKKMLKRCKAYSATSDHHREKLWKKFIDAKNKSSQDIISQKMIGFNNERRMDEYQDYTEKFFRVLVKVFSEKSYFNARTFYDHLFPHTDDLIIIEKYIEETLLQVPPNLVQLKNMLEKSQDEIKKKIKRFELFLHKANIAQGK